MTVRENVHQLVDALPEDRLADALDYLADLRDTNVSLSPETQAAIEEGLDDIRNGRPRARPAPCLITVAPDTGDFLTPPASLTGSTG